MEVNDGKIIDNTYNGNTWSLTKSLQKYFAQLGHCHENTDLYASIHIYIYIYIYI